MSRQLVYETSARDAVTRLPVVIIDSTVIADGRLPDPETEVPAIVSGLPSESAFVIVFFASRAPKSPQLSWLRRVHGMLSRDLRKRIQKVYIVHAKWYTRALNKAVAPIVSPKFARKTVFLKSLAELSHYMDITAIDISPAVYLDDIQRSKDEDIDELGHIPVPKQSFSIFGEPLPTFPSSFWRAAFTFLMGASTGPEVFRSRGSLSDEEDLLVSVLMHAVAREQKLRLFDYGPTVVFGVIREYLLSLPEPLIDLRDLPLPMEDSKEYASAVVSELPSAHVVHLEDIVAYSKLALERVDPRLLARSIGPAISRIRKPSKEGYAIASRFSRTLVEQWPVLTASDMKPDERPAAALRQPTALQPPALLPPRTPIRKTRGVRRHAKLNSEVDVAEVFTDYSEMPRNLPSEILQDELDDKRMRVPNRKAFGRVAEIMRIYDENHFV